MVSRRWLAVLLLAAPLWARSPLVVLSYNIHHGAGMDGKLDLERIAEVVRSVKPDLVALQEVDCRTARTGRVDQARELARLTGLEAVFGSAMDYDGGQYGNAVLTRLPVLASQVHPLPGKEPRALLEVRLRAAAGELLFFATHLDATRPEDLRKEAAEKIVRLAAARGDMPALLAGDMNSTAERDAIKVLRAAWEAAGGERERPTVPVDTPRRQIDWIFYRPPARWSVTEVRVLEEKMASDHRPILAVLEMLP